MDTDHTQLAAFFICQIVYGLFNGVAYRTHCHNDIFCLRIAVIVKRQIVAAGELCNLAHIAGHDVGDGIVILVHRLAGLEVNVRVLGGTAGNRFHRVEGAGAECLKGLLADQRTQILAFQKLYFLYLVGSAESVKEMHEGQAALNGRQVCDCTQVHSFLRVV